MPTDNVMLPVANTGMDIASRRILRHALGVSLSLFVSQVIDWPLSFLAAVFTTALLSLPIPPPSLNFSFLFVVKLVGAVFICQALQPFIEHAPMAGVILVALAGLIYGAGIFKGEGMHPKGAMWQYAYLTMLIILAPTVGSMAKGQAANDRFWFRQFMFMGIALYGYLAVVVFDAFWTGKNKSKTA